MELMLFEQFLLSKLSCLQSLLGKKKSKKLASLLLLFLAFWFQLGQELPDCIARMLANTKHIAVVSFVPVPYLF
jgi:hypothetical protein